LQLVLKKDISYEKIAQKWYTAIQSPVNFLEKVYAGLAERKKSLEEELRLCQFSKLTPEERTIASFNVPRKRSGRKSKLKQLPQEIQLIELLLNSAQGKLLCIKAE